MIDHGITVENLMRVFPMAFTEDKRLLALGKAIAEELVRREAEAKLGILYADIDNLPEKVLDILAYDFKVDWWDTSYTLEEKRRTLKDSWKVHRIMGTKAAVELGLSGIYPDTQVEEWFEYGGKPYHFKLTIDTTHQIVELKKHEQVLNRVNYYKSLRSHLECITYIMRCDEDAMLRLGGQAGSITRTPILEQDDIFAFEQITRLGGQVGTASKTPISERPDVFHFGDTAHIGGQTGSTSKTPIAEQEDKLHFVGTAHAGGSSGSASKTPITEREDKLRFKGAARVGGNGAGTKTKTSIQEQPDQFRFVDRQRIGAGQGGAITKSPLLE